MIGRTLDGDGRAQRCLAPPDASGRVESVVAAGEHADDETACVLRDDAGRLREIALSHAWPVRQPRPVARRLTAGAPLVTGQRILDGLFPVAIQEFTKLPGVSDASKKKILWDNCARLYGLSK